MPPVLTPPRPAEPEREDSSAVDPDALIKEARRRARRRRAGYAAAGLLAVGATIGLFAAGNEVIKRLTKAPDELVRIDARTLTIRARASFPASVATVAHGRQLWAAL